MATKIDERAAQSAQMSVSHEKIMQRLQNLYSADDGGQACSSRVEKPWA
jgi:hypothetical protein